MADDIQLDSVSLQALYTDGPCDLKTIVVGLSSMYRLFASDPKFRVVSLQALVHYGVVINPDRPSGHGAGDDSIVLHVFDAPPYTEIYNLERAPDVAGEPGDYAVIVTNIEPNSSYTDTPPGDGFFWYRVTASNPAYIGISPGIRLNTRIPPADFTQTVTRSHSPEVLLAVVPFDQPGAGNYRWKRSADADGPFVTLADTADPHYIDADVSNHQIWYYEVLQMFGGTEGPATESGAVYIVAAPLISARGVLIDNVSVIIVSVV